jgi:diadenosine tetraphosphate (Ap4A) HIT family hydrolase
MLPSSCKICKHLWPPGDHLIGQLGVTTAYLFEDQYFAGWTVLVLNDHVTELFELSLDMRSALMEEVSRVAQTLSAVFSATKINYELLGNQVPHIHWHLIPRLADDPFPLQPVWCVQHHPVRLAGSELTERVQQLRQSLG